MAVVFFYSNAQLASGSPNRATKGHDFDTFLPSSENNIVTRECYSYRKKHLIVPPYLENALKKHYLRIYHEKQLTAKTLYICHLASLYLFAQTVIVRMHT